jgi:protein O-mannosyl-transferase
MTNFGSQWHKWGVCLLLGAVVLTVFWPAVRCNFVYIDDPDYVLSNKDIQHGLNWTSIRWAFTTSHTSNWHPLTWISHIVDCELYGLAPAGHHISSLLLHVANSVLLFLLLNHITGALGRSAFVAALFALHPLRVESVVWISERKDVLSTFFWIVTVFAYVRFAEEFEVQPSSAKASEGKRSRFKVFYALALVLFTCALMSKAMVVTLPCVLLLLDYWPLGRLEFGAGFSWRLILEKIPFFVLAAVGGLVTFLIQRHFGVVATLQTLPIGARLANISVAYVTYLFKNIWPTGLAVYYPREELGPMEVGGAICLLAGIGVLVLWQWRARPYLAVGWLWFLGMLAPTIGFLQVGNQFMADRYSYLPSVGLWIMVAWGVWECVGHRVFLRNAAALAGAGAVLACVILTPLQERYWQNTGTLFARTAEVTDKHYVVYYKLGCDALGRGDYPQAIDLFKTALHPDLDVPWLDHSRAYNNLGLGYMHIGEITNAVSYLELAVRRQPRYADAYYNMGCAFLTNGQPDVAVDCFQHALVIDANLAEVQYKLANTMVQLGRPAEAIAHYSQALKLRPGMGEAANNLAWLLATCPDRSLRDGERAVALARQASAQSHNQNPILLGTLAAALAENGNLSEAAATAQRARALALAQTNRTLAGVLESQWRQYQGGGGGSPQ